MSDNDVNKIQQYVKELQDQNAIDFQEWKKLGKDIEKLSQKIKLSDTNLITLMKKIKSDYESLKKIVIDENIQVQLNNKIEQNKNDIVDTNNKIEEANYEINSQLNSITPNVKKAIQNSSDALGKADNPIETMVTNGQKIPYSLWDEEAIKAITGTGNLVTNLGIEKNKGVDYPLKAMTRDEKISSSSEKIKNGILDIKILGAKKGKYYRLEWLGNGVELLGGERYDVLLSEYNAETYSSNSSNGVNKLITLDDNLGLNKGNKEGNVVTKIFTSLRENISIQITYDKTIIGTHTVLNDSSGSGYSFIIDETCYIYSYDVIEQSNPSMYVKKENDHFIFAWKYNDTTDIHIHINRFSANKLMLIGKIAFVENNNKFVSKDFSKIETEFTGEITDWLSPYIVKAVNNSDGDKINSEYDFVGGCHNYNNTATTESSATARLLKYDLFVNGMKISENGIYQADKVKIICTNRIQANNTKKENGKGREVLEECIVYNINASKISVSNTIRALESVYIDRYYGLQSYIMGFVNSPNSKINYVDGKNYTSYDVNKGSSSNCGTLNDGADTRKIIIYNDNHILNIEIDCVGLAKKRSINTTTKVAFQENNKTYFSLINEKRVTLNANDNLYVSGSWEFISK